MVVCTNVIVCCNVFISCFCCHLGVLKMNIIGRTTSVKNLVLYQKMHNRLAYLPHYNMFRMFSLICQIDNILSNFKIVDCSTNLLFLKIIASVQFLRLWTMVTSNQRTSRYMYCVAQSCALSLEFTADNALLFATFNLRLSASIRRNL